jgi:hypothetical protein
VAPGGNSTDQEARDWSAVGMNSNCRLVTASTTEPISMATPMPKTFHRFLSAQANPFR